MKKRRTYTSPDGSFVLVEWALDTDDDHQDLNLVKDVNPAPWHTKTALRRRRDSPSTTLGQWLRFACGIWTAGDRPTTAARLWDAARVDIGGVDLTDTVYLAPSWVTMQRWRSPRCATTARLP